MNVTSIEWKGQQIDSPIIFKSNVLLIDLIVTFVYLSRH